MLHRERKVRFEGKLIGPAGDFPDGTMLAASPDQPKLKWRGRLWDWSHEGYSASETELDRSLTVITPVTIVAAIAAGYPAISHPTVGA